MSWATIYIRGRNGFQNAITSKLRGMWLLGSPEAMGDLIMFWLPQNITERNLKISIGSKLIFKYRLQFISNLNCHLKLRWEESTKFSVSENEMIDKMING